MRITKISIEKFRSIQTLDFDPSSLTAICGPNSCGKSNVLRAVKFAFLPSYSPDKMPENICNQVTSPNAACQVKLTFDSPTSNIASSLGLPPGQAFTYSVSVKRNGAPRFHLNGAQISVDRRKLLLDGILVVHVPPVRDIAVEGLKPFKDTLADVLRKTRGAASFAGLNDQVCSAVKRRGRVLLDGTRNVARHLLHVDELVVDTDGINLEQLLPAAGLKVRIGKKEFGLDKLGTGHQSTVILRLYRQLGEEAGRFVLYLFEEPDNHLHPTSLRAIGEDLAQCSAEQDSQVLLTTHSPYLLNQFDHQNILALTSDKSRLTLKRPKNVLRSDRDLRVALGKYGLKPAEALLADKVVIVEGPNDVTFLRTLIELRTGISPDRQDILIIPAGGKQPAADLSSFLHELGVKWRVIFDWDVTENTSAPLFQTGLGAADVQALTSAVMAIKGKLHTLPTKDSKAKKLADAMLKELSSPTKSKPKFTGSILDVFIRKLSLLDASQLKTLQTRVAGHYPLKIRQLLAPKGIWVWSNFIEEVILCGTDAENEVEALLRTRGTLTQPFSTPEDRRLALLNILHNSTHEPNLIREVVESLWNAKRFDHSEVKSAINFLVS